MLKKSGRTKKKNHMIMACVLHQVVECLIYFLSLKTFVNLAYEVPSPTFIWRSEDVVKNMWL